MTASEHIALVGPAFPYRGGIAQFSDGLATALRERQHRVTIHTFSRQYPRFLFPGKTQLEAPLNALPENTRAAIDSLNPLTWYSEAAVIARSGARRAVFAYWLPFFAPAYILMAVVLRRRGIRVIGLIHNALPHARHIGDRLLSRLFMHACDRVVVLSSSVAGDLRELDVTTPVVEAHHPVYLQFGERIDRTEARAQLALPADASVILFFGFIRRYKGLQVLLEAMPSILAEVPDLVLVVAGEFYEDESALRARVHELELDHHVQFADRYIPAASVSSYFSAADLVVQPYVRATQSGVAPIAFHFGVPLVVTDVGALAEVVPHEQAGLVVRPDDPQDLAGAVARFFQNETLRKQLSRGAAERRNRYTWEAVCDAIEIPTS